MMTLISRETLEEIQANLVPGWKSKKYADKGVIDLGFEAEEDYLKNVVRQVVIGNSEGMKISTSIMIYGPSGCGKSQMTDRAIKSIYEELGENEEAFGLVVLDGAYCFSLQDSVREIWEQLLCDDKDALDDLGASENEPFDEKLEKMLVFLRQKLAEKKKSAVIVIDGMEKFTDDSSQRLLYNLFDISANAVFSVPICIVGITPCVDILDSFEKRVRSRFSHRQINLVPRADFPQYQTWVEKLLSSVKDARWNSQVQEVLKDKDVVRTLRSIYEADKSIGNLKRFLYFATLTCEGTFTASNVTETYAQLYGSESHVQMALDFSPSELAVLLGIYKKIQRSQQAWQPTEVFEIVKKPYCMYQLRKEDFVKTIIKLQDLELIVPVGGSKLSRTNIFESYFKCEISFQEFQEIWKNYPNLPSFFNEFL